MHLQEHYDWIVLGNHPAALLSACLVAKLGFSVLMLPLGAHMGLSYSRSGQYLDPESNTLLGLGMGEKHSGLIWKILSNLESTPAELERIDKFKVSPGILTQSFRFGLLHGEHLHAELLREFGKTFTKQLGLEAALKQTESDYLTFWENLPKRLSLNSKGKQHSEDPMTLDELRRRFIQRHSGADVSFLNWISKRIKLSKLASSLERPELVEVFKGLWYGVSANVTSDPSLFELLHILSLSQTSASFKGGLTLYRDYLTNLAIQLGAQVVPKTECRRLFVDRGRLLGVQLANRGNMISVGGGVVGCSLGRAYERMTQNGRVLFRKRKEPLVPIGWKMTLGLTVHREVVPLGMLSRSIWQDKDAPALEFEIVDPATYELNDPDHWILYLRTVMPYESESLKVDTQRIVAGRMFRKAVEILPFLEYHVTRIYPDFRKGIGESSILNVTSAPKLPVLSELSEVYGFSSLKEIPENLLVYSGTGNGVGSSTGIDGLFAASNEAYPMYGNLGPTVAALEAVAWLAHRLGLPGPLEVKK